MRLNEGLAGLVAEQVRAAGGGRRHQASSFQVFSRGRRRRLPFVPGRAAHRSRPGAGRARRADARAAASPRTKCGCSSRPARNWRRSSAKPERWANSSRRRIRRLCALAQNLWWSWDDDCDSLFRELDPILWREVDHNPIALLQQMPIDKLEERAGQLVLHSRINYAYRRMQEYLAVEANLGQRVMPACCGPGRWPISRLNSASTNRCRFIPAAWGCWPATISKRASDLNIPLVGIGLYYDQGYFRQRLDRRRLAAGRLHRPRQPAVADSAGHRPGRQADHGHGRNSHRQHHGPGLEVWPWAATRCCCSIPTSKETSRKTAN